MLDAKQRREILEGGKTAIQWEGEPMLGSIYGEEEIEAAVAAMRAAMRVDLGFGFVCEEIVAFENAFAEYAGTTHAIAVNSAGPGLDMCMRYLEFEPGDEVIVPAINFVASPLAVYGAGGQIVWGEVDPATLQLDPEDVERKITPRTRALLPVHMNGLAAPMDELLEVVQRHPHPKYGPPKVFGDAARACGGKYKGAPIGKHGFANVFSLHTMKNITTLGEGGMITTDDDDFADFCRATRFYGMKRDVWGTSNVMTKVQAAVGSVQLRRLDGFIAARRRIAHDRDKMLEGLPDVQLPTEPPDRLHTYYLYTCVLSPRLAGPSRDAIIGRMDTEFGVKCLVANPPVYWDRPMLRAHTEGQELPLSDSLGARLLCLPTHPVMSDADNAYICAAFIECVEALQ